MKRRDFLGGSGLLGILAAGSAPAVQASQAVRWRLASSYTKSLDLALGGAQSFARRVKELSGGKFEISVFAADEILPSFGVFEGVQRGQVECGHTSPHYDIEREVAFALAGGIPFGLEARQMAAWLAEGGGKELLQELFRAHGLVCLPLGNTGGQMGGWFRKPLRTLADLKGLRMRIVGLGGKVMERLGVRSIALPPADIYKALEQNRLDAAEWVGPYDDLKLGLHRLIKYYAYPAWWEAGTQRALYVNQRAWEALSNENQAIVRAAAAETHAEMLAQYDARNPAALKELIAQGTRLMPFPPALLEAAWKAAHELTAELAAKSPSWKKIHASYARFQQNITWSWGYSELAYARFMHEKALLQQERAKSALARRR
ncbi:MAG: TRAP transporter substrate-binding protein DctP [Rhodocyclaceae bacterium]|nr:TRAP transporter substrate-binding protein DctP [Rhodocyclaceae bacterium]